MKILIIGGTGLISTAITRYLVERGDEVTLYNRGKTEARIPAGPKTILGDRKDYAAFEQQMAEAGFFDCVIDMVCFRPEEAESDVRAFSGRIGQLIFCSTAAVYSRPASRYPILEDEGRNALSEYGINKARCEDIFTAAHARGDYPVTILRPAFTYGEGRGLPYTFGWGTTFMDRLRKGKPVVVPGDGAALRAYGHIDDVGRTFVEAIGQEKVFGRAYHVPGDDWLSWNQHYQAVAEALGAPPPTLVHIPSRLVGQIAPKRAANMVENHQFNNILDNSAAKADLNFQHTVPYTKGFRRTIAWLDEHNRIENSDDDLFEDRLIAAWQRMSADLVKELADLEN